MIVSTNRKVNIYIHLLFKKRLLCNVEQKLENLLKTELVNFHENT